MKWALSVLTGAAVLGAGLVYARQAPTFHAGTNTVSVYATVLDVDGRPMAHLTRQDFSVYDDGKPQALTVFSDDVQPITIVIMLDRSGSMVPSFDLERDAAEVFVGDLLPGDKARLGSFSDTVQIDPDDFTSDPVALRRILHENLLKAGMTPLWNATGEAIAALVHERGRRVVLVFTDGADNPVGPASSDASPVKNLTLKDVRASAQAEEIMVYSIGLAACSPPERQGSLGAMPILMQGRGRGGTGGTGGMSGSRGRGGGGRGGHGGANPCVDTKPDLGLQTLSDDSGGRYFGLTSGDALGPTFARIADELHRQYVLGFTAPKLDGKIHKLEVRVRMPNLTIHARQSYVAPSSKK